MADLEKIREAIGDHDYGKIEQALGDRIGSVFDLIHGASQTPATQTTAEAGQAAQTAGTTAEGVNITPAAADHAAELGVDPADVEGTGAEGRVTKADVEDHAAQTEA